MVILILLGVAVLFVLGSILTAGSHPILIVVLVVLLACVFLFPSMTIEIGNGVLTWSFGPGVIHKSVQVADIESVKVVQNRWFYGWGIRLTSHGWLYNVSGLGAVEIGLKNGKRFRLGTDEPEALVHTIETAQAQM